MIKFQGKYGACFVNPEQVAAIETGGIGVVPREGSTIHLKGGAEIPVSETIDVVLERIKQ